ncbi:hypothetical protein F4859DRAFT_518460 [Xylaria cf. heliscus]|nr:hypothetical protein F4859DRAFT_518460 [Xylaria cf. heliscus]
MLNEAVITFQDAIDAIPLQEPDRAAFLNNFGPLIAYRGNSNSTPADLDKDAEIFSEAVKATTADDLDRPGRPSNLALTLGGDDADRAFDISELVIWLSESCKMINDQSVLEEAIRYSREAVNITPAQNSNWAKFSSNLSMHLSKMYYMTRQPDDLHEAICILQYNITRELEDLNESIYSCRSAVSVTPTTSPKRAKMLTHRGMMLGDRYNRTKSLEDLEEATRCSQEAVEEGPSQPDIENWLNNLGLRLGKKYDIIKDLSALEGAIENHRRAINETLPARLNCAKFLNRVWMKLAER